MTIDLSDDDIDEEGDVASLVDAESDSDDVSNEEGNNNDDDVIVEDVKDKISMRHPPWLRRSQRCWAVGCASAKGLHLMFPAQRAKSMSWGS